MSQATGAAARTFTNPIVTSEDAADPWAVFHGGFYYFTATFGGCRSLRVWKSPTLTGMDRAEKVTVWHAPASGPQSRQVWAPELYRFGDHWYLYYTASDGVDANHRHYVLESAGGDALGPYRERGRVDPAFERYAIDGSLLRMPDGRLYFLYAAGGLCIAPMESPLRVSGPGVKFASGTHEWERAWVPAGGERVRSRDRYWIEAPVALLHGGDVFVTYSAGHSATPHYYVGLLRLRGDDPLDPAAWLKHPEPVFGPHEGPDGGVYTTGHNSFTKSPDGTEDWVVYHAKDMKTGGFKGRTARAQRFTWNADGTPNFGRPVPSGVPLPVPSGEKEPAGATMTQPALATTREQPAP
jgi:GH43 family beta-xylosidase